MHGPESMRWFIVVFFIALGYSYFAAFYQASAREVKHLDSMLCSLLYAHFLKTLTGLPTIQSYGEMKRFIAANRYYVDLEDRALYIIITNQSFSQMACNKVALLAVMDVSGINAAQIGLVLTYTTILSQTCSQLTRQTADVEWYSLPNVLRGILVKVRGGEKIGIVGRTGAGKSLLMLVLFQIVELSSGSITIDGIPSKQSHSINGVRCHSLDSTIESKGVNLSVGERSLLSLAHALVKDCKVIVLDEAT
ncbi:P-loop containing nucleoside triphosphate hydrolase protein [Suillus hirtellus]|nr:P-loop containing nucleoside triphosphate hydrolase protein [Suillus hirtellus]